jgi:hypothetical protein
MNNFDFACEYCGALIDQSTGLCTNPNCPGSIKSQNTNITEE